jgi:hypothetical protein
MYSVEQPPHCDLLSLSPWLDDWFPPASCLCTAHPTLAPLRRPLPPPPTIIVTSTICNILRNLSPPPSILRPSSLFCAIHKTVEPFASSNLSKIYASENGRILHKSAPHFHLSSIIPNMFFFSANTISHSQNETIQKYINK